MKTIFRFIRNKANIFCPLLFLSGFLFLSIVLESCSDKCESTHQYTYYEPVYTTLPEIRASIRLEAPKPISGIGKIYFKDGYLLVNDPGEGIHIIDNKNPSAPVTKSFLKIPGNYDLAVKGQTLYADSYIDLVVLDISNIDDVKEINRIPSLFTSYNSLGFYPNEQWGVITDWVEKEEMTITKWDCIEQWGGFMLADGIGVRSSSNFSAAAAIAPGNNSGVGGSMARFTISNNHLYAIDGNAIQTLNIVNEISPISRNKTSISWDIETIFPYEDKLFIGSQSGMHILDASVPDQITLISTYSHIRSCDPVVVSGQYAYVTLRSGTTCQGFTNQLEVIDITNLVTPQLVKIYPMFNPFGLGIDNKTLFVCDGKAGLKVYDATDVNKIDQNLLAHYGNIDAYDVIPFNDVLMLIGEEGIFQFDYSDPKNIKILSQITLEK